MTTSSRIGPQLPPSLRQSDYDDKLIGPALPGYTGNKIDLEPENNGKVIGPVLPTGIGPALPLKSDEVDTIGPTLPPEFKRSTISENLDLMGPALPPHMRKEYIGPSLPPQMLFTHQSARTVIGPILPNAGVSDSDDEDDGIGPRLSEAADSETQNACTAAADFERRAERMKNKILMKDSDVQKREEWMTELPSRLVPQIGLGARSFKKQASSGKDDDRSEWTDTPADRKRKAEMGNTEEQGPSSGDIALHRRNEMISKNLQDYNKSKRSQSLLDMHQKKRKKDKKKEKTKEERREFDRDKDLNIQNVDAKEAKSFIDKAKLFGGKFSHGSSHFL